jgi:integrase
MKWRVIGDIRPDSFIRWRSTLTCSAKTNKEYQVSLMAFLNWLVRTERISSNPLARVGPVETRGREVRKCRSFTEQELGRLFAIAGKRLLAYQTLLYTGQRYSEVDSLVWGDLHLEEDNPFALFRASTTKDKDKRAVPLHPELAKGLLTTRPHDFEPAKKVFWWRFPTYEILQSDFKRAGIEQTNAMGFVVHFHSFRKTWQTMGVRCGVNQRSAQAILGHSDPSMTANVYTDVPALNLHSEIAKFPWISGAEGSGTQICTQTADADGHSLSFPVILAQLIEAVKVIDDDRARRSLTLPVTSSPSDEMAAQGGIRDKILRVSMPFEKGRKWTRKLPAFLPPEKLLLGSCSDARSVVLKVHSWVAQLQEGKVKSCAEIARREGITRARVSQLWPLSEISRQQADDACTANMGREISLRRLIKVARNPDAK